MALNPLSGAGGPTGIAGAGMPQKVGGGAESFGKVMKGQLAGPEVRGETSPTPVQNGPVSEAKAVSRANPGATKAEHASQPRAVEAASASREAVAGKVLDQVSAAQKRMDEILKVAESGKSFSPAELLSLQAHVYSASQQLDLAGKVVEKATGGVKQVLQTQV